jgi:insertion element IS1 protein InsB
MDEMWSFYHDKSHQIWLWWAVDHATNTPLAYTFGTREHKYLDELLALLKPFNIGTVYADNNYAYRDRISPDDLITGKTNTQQIERNHLTLRTRIKRLCRKSICFSKNIDIHKAVIGTFINTFFFGCIFDVSTVL